MDDDDERRQRAAAEYLINRGTVSRALEAEHSLRDDAPAMLDLLREMGDSADPDHIGPEWWERVGRLLDKHGRKP